MHLIHPHLEQFLPTTFASITARAVASLRNQIYGTTLSPYCADEEAAAVLAHATQRARVQYLALGVTRG